VTAPVRVTGMSGAGNDFLVVGPEAGRAIEDRSAWARRVCRRGLSLGADGVLFVDREAPDTIRVRFVNPDGSSAFCGNGSRCAARFALLEGLASERMTLLTDAGAIPAEVSGDQVRLTLPAPTDHGEREVGCGDRLHRGRFVTAGIPHFILFVDDVDQVPLAEWGPELRRHEDFGEAGTNVDVATIGPSSVAMRTWERGVEGETLCCGSGAVAVAFAARLRGGADRIELRPAGGVPLIVELPGEPNAPGSAVLEGEARVLFRGEADPEAWAWPG